MVSGSPRDWLELDGEAELFEPSNEVACFGLRRAAIEIGGTEVVVFDAVLEDVIDCGEDRCGDGANGFLRPAPGLDPEELSSVVAVFGALGGPGALHEHGFEPRRPLAQT